MRLIDADNIKAVELEDSITCMRWEKGSEVGLWMDAPTIDAIPVEWLKEKLTNHPELSYAVTDGINNVLDLWEQTGANE